jgi:hypothetical protein
MEVRRAVLRSAAVRSHRAALAGHYGGCRAVRCRTSRRRYAVADTLTKLRLTVLCRAALFGVFDGHAGRVCAETARDLICKACSAAAEYSGGAGRCRLLKSRACAVLGGGGATGQGRAVGDQWSGLDADLRGRRSRAGNAQSVSLHERFLRSWLFDHCGRYNKGQKAEICKFDSEGCTATVALLWTDGAMRQHGVSVSAASFVYMLSARAVWYRRSTTIFAGGERRRLGGLSAVRPIR